MKVSRSLCLRKAIFLWCNLVQWRHFEGTADLLTPLIGITQSITPPAAAQMSRPKRQRNWLNVIVGRPLSNNRGG